MILQSNGRERDLKWQITISKLYTYVSIELRRSIVLQQIPGTLSTWQDTCARLSWKHVPSVNVVLLRRQALNKGHTNEMYNYKQWSGLRKKDHKKILSSGISFDWGGQTDQIRCFWESALNVQVGGCMMELTIGRAEYWGKQWDGWVIGWGRRLAMNISACQVCWAGELEEEGRDG